MVKVVSLSYRMLAGGCARVVDACRPLLVGISRGIDWLNNWLGYFVAWMTSVLVLAVCVDVFCRYVLHLGIIWLQDLEWHLFSVIFLLGAAWSLQHDRHVRVDLIYTNLPRRAKAWIDLVGICCFLIPFATIIVWESLPYIRASFRMVETSADSGLPARYLIKSVIPTAFVLILLQGLALGSRAILVIRDGAANEEH